MGLEQAMIIVIIAVLTVQVYSADVKTLYTNGHYCSQYFRLEDNLTPDKVLRFSVRAPKGAHILFAPTHQADGPVYEVVLGAEENRVTHIRGRCPCQEEPSATIEVLNLLSSREFRNFWIRIKADRRRTFIQVGIGGRETPFHEWRDSRPISPLYLSFRSDSVAEWKYGYSDEANTIGISDDQRKTVVTSAGFGQYYPLSDVVCHYDDAVILYFTVRSSREFQIIFTSEVSYSGDAYEFGLNERGVSIRRRHLGKIEESYAQDGFLNDREQLKFWIRIAADGRLTLGQGGSSSHVILWRDLNPLSPQFVSFSLYRSNDIDPGSGNSADLQYGLGPDYTLATQNCRPQWKQASNQKLPIGSVRGGRNIQNEIFICRANDDRGNSPGSYIPGSYVPGTNGRGSCVISSGSFAITKPEFQVLIGCQFSWIPGALGTVPKNAISARETANGVKIYVVRAAHQGQLIVGRLQADQRLAYIPFDNQVLPFTNYEVLVNSLPVRTATGNERNNPAATIG